MPINLREIERQLGKHFTGAVLLPSSVDTRGFNFNVAKVQAENGVLLLGPGTFYVNGNIDLISTEAKPLYIIGQGKKRTKVKFIGNHGFRGSGVIYLHMRGMSVDTDQSKFSATAAVALDEDSAYPEFTDIAFEGGFAIGLKLTETYQVDVDLCSFYSGKGMVIHTPDAGTTSPQYTISRCQFNAENGILGIEWDTGGESVINRCYFGNYMDATYGGAIGAVKLVRCGNTVIQGCTFESNNTATGNEADIILEDCGTITIIDPKMVTSGIEIAHDFIRVQGTDGAGNGCARLVIVGADINGRYLPGGSPVQVNYFVQWLSGTGMLSIIGPVNQTHVTATYGTIPILTGTPTNHNTVRKIPLTPVYDRRSGNFPAMASDTHGSFVTIVHIDETDANAAYKVIAYQPVRIPQDYVAGSVVLKFIAMSTANGGNYVWDLVVKEFNGDPDSAYVSLLASTEVIAAHAQNTTPVIHSKTLTTNPTVGRSIWVEIGMNSNHADDSNTGTRAIYDAWLEYTPLL